MYEMQREETEETFINLLLFSISQSLSIEALTTSHWEVHMNEDKVDSCGFPKNLWVGDIKEERIDYCTSLILEEDLEDWKLKVKYVGALRKLEFD